MSKKVYLDSKGREGLYKGIQILSQAVASTLGPTGKAVIIKNGIEPPFATKDGVTVAKSIEDSDPLINAGIQLVKSTSIKMDEKSGDGTTSATVLCDAMIYYGFEHLKEINDVVAYKQGMEAAVNNFEVFVRQSAIQADNELIEKIAIISANNDIELGKLVAGAVIASGEYGRINILESLRLKSSYDKFEGFSVDLGLADQIFSNDRNTGYFHSKKASLLLHKGKITDKEEWLLFIERVSKLKTDIVLIAQDYSKEVIELAKFANSRNDWPFKVCLVRNPMRENEFEAVYQDLEEYTGATSIDKFKGEITDLGVLNDIVIKPGYSLFGPTEIDCTEYLSELKQLFEEEQDTYKKEVLRRRICQFTDGYINFYVGGYTEVEAKERYDRVQDSVNACRAAIESGIVIGGGQLLFKFYQNNISMYPQSKSAFNMGKRNIVLSLKSITEQIYRNSKQEIPFDQIENIINHSPSYGYDFKNNERGDLIEMGIVDPVKVVMNALYSALSIAGTILTTECVIVETTTNNNQTWD